MNEYICYEILQHLNSVDDVKNFCITSKSNHLFCKKYMQSIAKKLLSVYQVDYTDPTNFIYVYNHENINDFKHDIIGFDFKKIFKLYLKTYNLEKINYQSKGITSFPIQPKMNYCNLNGNQLTDFPIQPKMTNCYLEGNQLTIINVI